MLIGCGPSEVEPAVFVLDTRVEAVIGEADPILGSATRLAVDSVGRLYLVDQQLSQVVVVDTEGQLTILAQEGEGPGEVSRPVAIRAAGDTVRVVDAGNGRVQLWTLNGDYVGGRRLEVNASSPMVDVSDNGWLAIPTMGLGTDSLITLLDAQGVAVGQIGQLPGGSLGGIDMQQTKAAIRDRQVPAFIRNFARPVFASHGGLWVVLLAEAQVRRYRSPGQQEWSLDLEGRPISEIHEHFFRRNAEDDSPFSFYPLAIAADAIEVNASLWLLLNQPDEAGSTEIWVVDSAGRTRCHLQLPAVSGAQSIAVDPARQLLLLGISSAGTVLRVRLPWAEIEDVCIE